jgi:hypothetical protein
MGQITPHWDELANGTRHGRKQQGTLSLLYVFFALRGKKTHEELNMTDKRKS